MENHTNMPHPDFVDYLTDEGEQEALSYKPEIENLISLAMLGSESVFDMALEALQREDKVWDCVLDEFTIETLPRSVDKLVSLYMDTYAELEQ